MELAQRLQLPHVFTTIYMLHLGKATTVQPISSSTDLYALLSFKSLATEDPSGAMSSWSSNETMFGFCHWKGVTCSSHAHPGRVTALRMRDLGLVGAISPQLSNLTYLQALDLSNNRLQGEIPMTRQRARPDINLRSTPVKARSHGPSATCQSSLC